jgi:O-antigen/teichoic acid export membrane protein
MSALLAASVLTLAGHLIVNQIVLKLKAVISGEFYQLRKLLKFGIGMVSVSISALVLVNAERGIIAYLNSPKDLAHYNIAFTLNLMVSMFSGSLLQSMVPAFSQLQSPEKRGELNLLYSRGCRFSLLSIIPIVVLMASVARPAIYLYAGRDYLQYSTVPFYILLTGLCFNLFAYLPNAAILSAGKTNLLARLYWFEVLAYVPLVIILTYFFGIVGSAIAWAARVMLDSIGQFLLAQRFANVRFPALRLKLIYSILFIVVVALTTLFYFNDVSISGFLINAFVGATASALYIWFAYRNLLAADEKEWLKMKLSRFPFIFGLGSNIAKYG